MTSKNKKKVKINKIIETISYQMTQLKNFASPIHLKEAIEAGH